MQKLYIKDTTPIAINDISRMQQCATKSSRTLLLCSWFQSIIDPKNVANLQELWLYECGRYPMNWNATLQAIPSLRRLFFGSAPCTPLIQLLTPVRDAIVLCPNVRELRLHFAFLSIETLSAGVQSSVAEVGVVGYCRNGRCTHRKFEATCRRAVFNG